MEEAIASPRLHCMGTLDVTMEKNWPKPEQAYLKKIGFQVTAGSGAFASAVSFNPRTGECEAAER